MIIRKKKLAKLMAEIYAEREVDGRKGKEEWLRAADTQSAINYIFSKFYSEKERIKYIKEAMSEVER